MADVRKNRTTSRSKATDKLKCIFCATVLDSKVPAITCDNCENWVCLSCSKIPKPLYDELSKCDGNIMEWSCKVCKSTKTNLRSIGESIQELKTTNNERLDRVENRIGSLEETMKDTVQSEVEKVKDSISESLKNDIASTVEELVEKRIKEIEERKSRSTNILIFKLKMSDSEEASTRKQHDTELIQKLFKLICPDKDDLQIRTCFRLINRKKPRTEITGIPPLKVILHSKEQRRNLLQNSKDIVKLQDENLKHVIIAKDLTLEQRKASKKWHSERTPREEEGEGARDSFREEA